MGSGAGLFVVTGGPGSGKSALIDALRARGVAVSDEVGRAVIRQQVAIGGQALPWADKALFAELMLSWELRAYEDAARHGVRPVVFDRGVPDVVGYLRLSGLPVPAHMLEAAEVSIYAKQVFIAPPWPEIFAQAAERKQDFAEALRTHAAMAATYAGFGYDLVELPKTPATQRADFVIEHMAAEQKGRSGISSA